MTEAGRFATRPWTPADDEILRSLARNGVDARAIGSQLNRTAVAVRSRAGRLNIPFKKTTRKRYQNHRPSTVRIPEKATTLSGAWRHVIRSMTTRAAHELDGAVGCVF
jgi:hypothetical protein